MDNNRQTNDTPTATAKFDGYLAFLSPPDGATDKESPLTIAMAQQEEPAYRQYHNHEFCWFELKDTIANTPFRFVMETKERYLWILIQRAGNGSIGLSPLLTIENGIVYCYHTPNRRKTVSLEAGKSWCFMAGIAESQWADLTDEYPLLQPLHIPTGDDVAQAGTLLGWMNLQTKLTDALEALTRFEFRPFSLSFRLSTWNLRLFNLVFKELKMTNEVPEDIPAALHHKATRYIEAHFMDEDISVQSVAEAMHISIRSLYHCFEGKRFSVMGYVQELRLMWARRILIDSRDTLASIAFTCHFACAKNFSRLFKKRFQISPNDYRIMMQGNISFKNSRRSL